MPKKSKRRANKASGGSGKSAGGNGAGTAGEDSNKHTKDGTAKNFAAGGDGSGILTKGAVQTLANASGFRTFRKKDASIVQISEKICIAEATDCIAEATDCTSSMLSFAVSDGERCMTAFITSMNQEAWTMISERKAILFSTIRLLQVCAFEGKLQETDDTPSTVLVVGNMEIVERNVGRLIGNPTPLVLGSPSQSVISAPPPVSAHSYAKKIQLAKSFYFKAVRLFDNGNGDVGAAIDCVADFFRFPREQTDPFRTVLLMQWLLILAQWTHEVKIKTDASSAMALHDSIFRSKRVTGILKFLSSDESGEGVHVRAVASFVRARVALGPPWLYTGFQSSVVSHCHRFCSLWSKCNLSQLATACVAVTGDASVWTGVIDQCLAECEVFLKECGGDSQLQASSIFDSSSSCSLPFYNTAGGNYCDCCGKSAKDANLSVLFKCKACRLAWYCSKSCQAKCWENGHQDHCKKFGCFENNDDVILCGLKKRYEMNGSLVRIEEVGSGGRATVQVLTPNSPSLEVGAKVSIKIENMRHHRPLK